MYATGYSFWHTPRAGLRALSLILSLSPYPELGREPENRISFLFLSIFCHFAQKRHLRASCFFFVGGSLLVSSFFLLFFFVPFQPLVPLYPIARSRKGVKPMSKHFARAWKGGDVSRLLVPLWSSRFYFHLR